MRTSVRLLGAAAIAVSMMGLGAPAFAGGHPDVTNESTAGDGGNGGAGGVGVNVLSCVNVINALGDTTQSCDAGAGGAGGAGGDAESSIGDK